MSGGKIVLLVLAAVGGVIILSIAACGGLIYWGFTSADQVAGHQVDALFMAIDEGRFAETYDTQTSADFQSRVSREEYAAFGEAIGEKLGSLESKSMQSFNMQQHNSDATVTATYSGKFQKGTAEIVVEMVKAGDRWLYDKFEVNSPVLPSEIAARTCPQCGAKHNASDKFCPQCGADLSQLPAGAPDSEVEASVP